MNPAPLPSETDAVVLAGGMGTRLRLRESDPQKVLWPVAGRPFLELVLSTLARRGTRRVVVSTGFLAEEVERHCGDGSRWGLTIVPSRETTPLGTGGAVRLAARIVRSDPFLVLNGDTFIDADLDALLSAHAARRAAATILLARVDDAARFGSVHLGEDGRVEGFLEKGVGGPGLVNAGVYVLSRAAVERLPDDTPSSLERDLFPALVGAGLFGLPTETPFLDIGTPESAARASELLGPRG